ncbi:hypothetical protein B0J13DRAFT_598868 [Dactylonectria estremocensis]|uniref:G domain-containing protein n=1 Tax=Dactylonectria estremocensis TaxID=1079267 RepID=A0A9P9DW24_9HYPO|nr:hypothetical protein B0J13DRAFT_598868 [Dactylonectria estremocensis]
MVQLTRSDLSTDAAPSSQADIPPTYDEASTINVIITGECQQGKSTLIQQLCQYAGAADMPIGIGDGNKACTMDVGNYDMSIRLRTFQMADAAGQPLERSQYSDLVALEEDEVKAVEVSGVDTPIFNFRFVDTPGLNDTQGEDFPIMSRILGRAADLGHVNALVYVRSVENHFGSSFKSFFRYIQRSMPSICNGLIVVHSCFTVDRVQEFLEEDQRLEDIRRDAFGAATQLELEHFFMDNSPDPTSPFAVVQSLNEIHRFLQHLASQKPLPVKSMNLLKTDAMRHMDVHVVNALKSLGHRLDKEWNQEKGTVELARVNVISAQREVSTLKKKIETRQSQIHALKTNEEIVLGKRSCVAHYSFVGDLLIQGKLNLGTKGLVYDSDHTISSVAKTCSPGSKWLDEELRGTHWHGEIFGNIFRDINGTVTFYTTSEFKHKKEIDALETAVVDLQDHLAVQVETLSRNTSTSGPDARFSRLVDSISKVEEITELIERDSFDVTLWPLFKGFYTKHTFPTPDDIRAFVKVYDENLGKLL